uniref:Ribonuclease A-domain domain-containing protein n=1 Tax=Moschus moschiferus TaxID=68415 RepID=A0A8C6D9N4_MOSMO
SSPGRARYGPLAYFLPRLVSFCGPVSAKPRKMPPAQWFETQHVQPRPQGCNTVIHKTNKFSKHCKDLNTCLHEPIYCVVTTCQTLNLSQKSISLTTCEPISGRCPGCRYKEKQLEAFFIILSLCPVHCTGQRNVSDFATMKNPSFPD